MRTRVILLLMALSLSQPADVNAQSRQERGQAVVLAYEAARADAHRNMIEAIRGLRVSSETTVQEMAVADQTIMTQLNDFVQGARTVEESIDADGVATVVLELDLARLSFILQSDVLDAISKIRMEGYGAAPPPDNAPATVGSPGSSGGGALGVQSMVVGSPEAWNREPQPDRLDTTIEVVGMAALEGGRSGAQQRLMGERAATADAYRKLLEYVYGLSISSTTTVRDMVLDNDQVDTQVSGFVRGARVVGTEIENGTAMVTMELDLRGLRNIVRR